MLMYSIYYFNNEGQTNAYIDVFISVVFMYVQLVFEMLVALVLSLVFKSDR